MESSEIIPIPQALRQRLKFSGWLIIAGLAVEVISLFWSRPLAFLLFVFAGGVLLAVGIVIYLYSLVSEARVSLKE